MGTREQVVQVSWLSVEERARFRRWLTPGLHGHGDLGWIVHYMPVSKNRLGMGHRAEKGVEVLDEHGVI